jgi:hypothetical protein
MWKHRAYEGEATAREARAVGVQWVFAPVADVNNNPAKSGDQHPLLRREPGGRGAST